MRRSTPSSIGSAIHLPVWSSAEPQEGNGAFRAIDASFVMSNNFAFGGINTSLVIGRS